MEVTQHERIAKDTPQVIRDAVAFPYDYFSNLLYGDNCLDVGCGEPQFHEGFLRKFEVTSADIVPFDGADTVDITKTLPYRYRQFDLVFCCEVIEHISADKQKPALLELMRVTNKYLILGSISLSGVDFIDGIEIFKAKNNKNKYHLAELTPLQFIDLWPVSPQWRILFFQSTWPLSMRPMKFDGMEVFNYGLGVRCSR